VRPARRRAGPPSADGIRAWRSPRSTRRPGEPATGGRGTARSQPWGWQARRSPVNTGAPQPTLSLEEAEARVLGIQTKLHQWRRRARCGCSTPARSGSFATATGAPRSPHRGPAARRDHSHAPTEMDWWRARCAATRTAGSEARVGETDHRESMAPRSGPTPTTTATLIGHICGGVGSGRGSPGGGWSRRPGWGATGGWWSGCVTRRHETGRR
jgi:hypothetical protein